MGAKFADGAEKCEEIGGRCVAKWGVVGYSVSRLHKAQHVLFLGEYEHTLDQKQRLAIPSEVREVLDEKVHGEAFIAAPGSNGSLWLWPEKTFAQLANALGGSIVGEPSLQEFERLVFSQAARVPLDSAGRVRIPDRLLQRFGLGGTILILGVRDHLELTNPEAWKRDQERLQPATEDIWRRARMAMATAQRQGT